MQTNTSKKKNESLVDYKLRLCENKDALNLTWDEVAGLINEATGDNFEQSKYRKWYASFSEGIDYAISNRADETVLEKKRMQELAMQKERAKLSSTKNEVNRWVRESARQELIAEAISNAVEQLEPIQFTPNLNKIQRDTEKAVTVDLADIHFGRSGTIFGLKGEVLAEYSEEIFYQRMEKLMQETIEVIKKENAHTLYVFNLGDAIDGLLRLTQLQVLNMGVIDSIMKIAEYLSTWLLQISEHVGQVEYHSVLGNHAEMRIAGIKSGELPHENLEKLIPWFIQTRLAGVQNINVHDAEFITVVNVLGTNICLTHGQNEKNLENSIKDYSMIYGEQIHMLKTGHLHHLNNKTIGMINQQNVEYVQSPSICGIDEYSMKLKKTANAGSLITVFVPKRKYCTYEIIL